MLASTSSPTAIAYDELLSKYGYDPSLTFALIGLVTFSLSTLAHGWQAGRWRMLWCIVIAIGGITEMIGYAARLWSHYQDWNNNPFLMQTVTLIIAPTFFSAALYVVLSRIITIVGPQYSPLSPKAYVWFFLAADVL